MRHTVVARTLALLLSVGLLIALPTLGGCKKDPGVPDTPVADAGTGSDQADADEAADGTESGGADASDGSDPGTVPNAPSTITVRLYWVEAGENAIGIERTLPYTQAVATAAMNALIAGPTAQEQTTWPAISTAIPAGTKLLGVTVANGVAKVDLSGDFESGGGTFSVTARLAQVVYTLTQFPTVDAVEFYLNGAPVQMFSSEGLILEGPQTLDDYDHLLPIDA